jgi:hypothetical protein
MNDETVEEGGEILRRGIYGHHHHRLTTRHDTTRPTTRPTTRHAVSPLGLTPSLYAGTQNAARGSAWPSRRPRSATTCPRRSALAGGATDLAPRYSLSPFRATDQTTRALTARAVCVVRVVVCVV